MPFTIEKFVRRGIRAELQHMSALVTIPLLSIVAHRMTFLPPATKSLLISPEISSFPLFPELFVVFSSGAVRADSYRDPHGNESVLRNAETGLSESRKPGLTKIFFAILSAPNPWFPPPVFALPWSHGHRCLR